MSTTLLVLAAGWEQADLVAAARARGHVVVTTAAPGVAAPAADAHHEVDPRDLPGLLAVAEAHAVGAVVSDQCDYGRYAQAWLAARLDLPGPDLAAVAPTIDKAALRAVMTDAPGVAQPPWRVVASVAEAVDAADAVGLPLAVKPVDNRGAFGVTRVAQRRDLAPAVLDALAHAHSRRVLLEGWVEGVGLMVDGAHVDGGHRVTAVASKRTQPGPHPVSLHARWPADLDPAATAAVRDAADAVAARLAGLGASGLTHTELAWDGRVAWLVESANRGGGCRISSVVVPAVGGLDTVGLLLDEATGAREVRWSAPRHAAVAQAFLPLPPGRVAAVGTAAAAERVDGVLAAALWRSIGDAVGPVVDGPGRNGMVIGAGDDAAAADAAAAAGLAVLGVVLEGGDGAGGVGAGGVAAVVA